MSGQVEHIWRWERGAWAVSDKLCGDGLGRWVVLAHGVNKLILQTFRVPRECSCALRMKLSYSSRQVRLRGTDRQVLLYKSLKCYYVA
jgi:hypothetical protein